MEKIYNFPKLGYRLELHLSQDSDWGFAFAFNIWKPGIALGLFKWLGYIQIRGGSNK